MWPSESLYLAQFFLFRFFHATPNSSKDSYVVLIIWPVAASEAIPLSSISLVWEKTGFPNKISLPGFQQEKRIAFCVNRGIYKIANASIVPRMGKIASVMLLGFILIKYCVVYFARTYNSVSLKHQKKAKKTKWNEMISDNSYTCTQFIQSWRRSGW